MPPAAPRDARQPEKHILITSRLDSEALERAGMASGAESGEEARLAREVESLQAEVRLEWHRQSNLNALHSSGQVLALGWARSATSLTLLAAVEPSCPTCNHDWLADHQSAARQWQESGRGPRRRCCHRRRLHQRLAPRHFRCRTAGAAAAPQAGGLSCQRLQLAPVSVLASCCDRRLPAAEPHPSTHRTVHAPSAPRLQARLCHPVPACGSPGAGGSQHDR